MKPHLKTLLELLVKRDFKSMLALYCDCSEAENIGQLALLYQQSQRSPDSEVLCQELAGQFIKEKGLPQALINHINNAEILNFFTPALQQDDNFGKTNSHGRNVLHYLFAGKPETPSPVHPPFNYLRSLMLFESNEILHDALTRRDKDNLTPLELYLAANQTLVPLPDHEFTAVLALIEIQSRKQPIDSSNRALIVSSVKALCRKHQRPFEPSLQRLQLVSAYYTLPIGQLLR